MDKLKVYRMKIQSPSTASLGIEYDAPICPKERHEEIIVTDFIARFVYIDAIADALFESLESIEKNIESSGVTMGGIWKRELVAPLSPVPFASHRAFGLHYWIHD
jgi:hypothetical protein